MAIPDLGQHDTETRERFEDVLRDFVDERSGKPLDGSYKLQEVNQNQYRITIYPNATDNTPLGQGDDITQYYFPNLGCVMLDLNPRED